MLCSLESLDDPRLDPYRDLKKNNRTRYAGWFIAEGSTVVRRLIDSRFEILSLLLAEHAVEAFALRVPVAVPVLVLPDPLVNQLVGFKFHAGVLACGRRIQRTRLADAPEIVADRRATLVACPHTILPDNLGSIIRISSAFGAQGVLVGEATTDPFSRRTIRVSMGNIFSLPIVEPPSLEEFLCQLRRDHGFCVVAATGRAGAAALPIPRPAERIVLLLGHEAHGLDSRWLAISDQAVSIPMSGGTDSLNVAAAAAVLLYQFTRAG